MCNYSCVGPLELYYSLLNYNKQFLFVSVTSACLLVVERKMVWKLSDKGQRS